MLTILFNQVPVAVTSDEEAVIGVCATPSRINERIIRFQRLDRTVSLDPDFGEPFGEDITITATIDVVGQVNFGSKSFRKRSNTLSGDEERVKGHLVFKMCDLIDAGLATQSGSKISFVLEKGDLVTRIGDKPTDFEVYEIRPESPLQGDFLLVYVDLVNHKEIRLGRVR